MLTPVRAAIGNDSRVSSAEIQGGSLVIELAPDQKNHHFLIELLIAKNVRIASFTPEIPRLEDAFMSLTKGQVQ